MRVTGACHCGTITIEGEADPERVSICHCTDCQTGTGSAFRVSVPIPGSPTSRRTTSGRKARAKVSARLPSQAIWVSCPR